MPAIIYDLETSDKLPIGQIINYAFVVVDRNLQIIDRLYGEVKLSRLQLPDPDAIAANRVDIQKLQANASDNELAAALRIFNFLSSLRQESAEPITLIGFNSAKFDLGYLRTCLIRNGLNPYISGIRYGDILHGIRALYLRNQEFADLMRKHPGVDGKLSFRLENCAHALKLLDGAQTHNSMDDVILTLEVVREIYKRFDFNLIEYSAYEGISYHRSLKEGVTVEALEIEYDIEKPARHNTLAYTLLDANENAALWINLRRYAETPTREAVQWLRDGSAALYLNPQAKIDDCILKLAEKARADLKKFNLRNFFEETSCDIELHIYRLDFDARTLLERAIHINDRAPLRASKNRDLQQLFRRFILANYQFSQAAADKDIWSRLKAYAQWRYGGKMQTNKTGEGSEFSGTFDQYVKRAEVITKERPQLNALMQSLLAYYANSDIFTCCAAELLSEESSLILAPYTQPQRQVAGA